MPEKYSPKILEENYNVSKEPKAKNFTKLFIGIIVMIAAWYFILGLAVNLIVPYLPNSFENSLSGLYECQKYNHRDKEKVEAIFKKLISNLDKEGKEINYTLCIVKNKEINAFAAPGGYIAIHSGLLDNADSDNEIAFVLAHELGHINNRDHLKTLGRSLITLIFFSALSNGSSSSFMSLITNNAENSFSRSQEKKSDIFALKLLLKTYNNADGALSFMKRIDKLMEGTKFLYYLSTHPMPDDRTDYIREFLKK